MLLLHCARYKCDIIIIIIIILETSSAMSEEYRILAEKFMPKTGPLSLGGRLICGTVFEVVYF